MADLSCKTCAYLGERIVNYTPDVWICRRNPPFAGGYLTPELRVRQVDVTVYPIVDEQSWCGEHQFFSKKS